MHIKQATDAHYIEIELLMLPSEPEDTKELNSIEE